MAAAPAQVARIRRYRAEDRAAVLLLFREFVAELTPEGRRAEFEAYVQAAIREELGRIEQYYLGDPGQGFWVAERGGVSGMVGVERHAADAAELRRMAVARAHRHRGVARALLRTAETFCRDAGYARIVLSTSELQQPAMRLYQSSGYRLARTEVAAQRTHKTPGAGLTRYHYEKPLAAVRNAGR
jgi:GNAT superfamily N-acetyltransferase